MCTKRVLASRKQMQCYHDKGLCVQELQGTAGHMHDKHWIVCIACCMHLHTWVQLPKVTEIHVRMRHAVQCECKV